MQYNKNQSHLVNKHFRLTENIKTIRNSENKDIWIRQKLVEPTFLASGSSDKTIKIWKLWNTKWKCAKTLVGHTSYVTKVLSLPSGKIVSASVDSTIKIWDFRKERNYCIKSIQANQDWIESLALIKNKTLIVSCSGETIKIWDYQGNCVRIINGYANDIKMCLELPNGDLCYCSWDSYIKIWNLNDEKCVRMIRTTTRKNNTQIAIKRPTYGIYCILLWHNQIEILAGSDNSNILCIDVNLGNIRKTLKSHTDCVMEIQKLTLRQFISGGGDKTIKIWDYDMGVCLQTISHAHSSWINSLVVLHTGEVLSCSNDKTIKVWNLDKKKCIQILRGHSSGVLTLSFASLI